MIGERCVLVRSKPARPKLFVLLAAIAVATPVAMNVPTAAMDRFESLGSPQTP